MTMTHACCRQPANLEAWVKKDRPDVALWICKVCGCRHYELTVAPVPVGVSP
jgi:hypothetical protein